MGERAGIIEERYKSGNWSRGTSDGIWQADGKRCELKRQVPGGEEAGCWKVQAKESGSEVIDKDMNLMKE